MLKDIQSILRRQEVRLLEAIQVGLSKNLFDENFNRESEDRIVAEEILPIMTTFYVSSGENAFRLFDEPGSDFKLTGEDRNTIVKRAEFFADEINKTTAKQMQVLFNESQADGDTLTELAEKINEKYDQITEGRALNMARTETLVANQSGLFSGYDKLNIPIKIWVSVLDDKTRESHVLMDGEEQLINQPFSNGLMHPGDPTGVAAEVINCRCTI